MERMNFDLAELQAFVAVAERQSFRAAAEARPHLSFGSYPFGFSVDQTPGQVGTHLVIRGRDSAEVDAAEHDLAANLRSSGIEIAAT